MSERNGDRARFANTRKRTLHHQERIHAFKGPLTRTVAAAPGPGARATLPDLATADASLAMQDEGGPMRAGD